MTISSDVCDSFIWKSDQIFIHLEGGILNNEKKNNIYVYLS